MVKRQKIRRHRPAKSKPLVKHIDTRRSPPQMQTKLILADSEQTPLYTPAEKRTKIALVQTGSWGDNINSTLMFKPLREHFSNCLIDVYTSSFYGDAFHNNPNINNIVKYESSDKQSSLHLTLVIKPAIENRGYDHIFAPHPMFNPENWTSIKHPEFGNNLICAWIRALEHANIGYELPLETSLRLTDREVQRVDEFCKKVNNMHKMRNVLLEVHGESGQSFWDHHWTIDTCKHLLSDPNTNVFISRRQNSTDVEALQKHAPGRVYFVGMLTLRECAQLFNKCQAFFSVSSGLSNACNTNWCKNDITWVETTNSPDVTSAPVRSDGKIFNHNNNLKEFINMLRDRGI